MADVPASSGGGSQESGDPSAASSIVRDQDRFLPIANVSRIMKKVIPPNGKMAKDAKEAIQEAVSEFIGFITSEASDKCQKEKRKTVNGDDLICAMATLGFDDYIEPLKLYLNKYKMMLEGDNRVPARGQRDGVQVQPNQDPQLNPQDPFLGDLDFSNLQWLAEP